MRDRENCFMPYQFAERVGGGSTEKMTPYDELAYAIVELSVIDYKEGIKYLRNLYGKVKTKKIMMAFDSLTRNKKFLKYYDKTSCGGCLGSNNIRYVVMMAYDEIKAVAGEEAEKCSEHLYKIYNLITAMLFLKESRWCDDLIGIEGKDILEMLKIASQKKQVA